MDNQVDGSILRFVCQLKKGQMVRALCFGTMVNEPVVRASHHLSACLRNNIGSPFDHVCQIRSECLCERKNKHAKFLICNCYIRTFFGIGELFDFYAMTFYFHFYFISNNHSIKTTQKDQKCQNAAAVAHQPKFPEPCSQKFFSFPNPRPGSFLLVSCLNSVLLQQHSYFSRVSDPSSLTVLVFFFFFSFKVGINVSFGIQGLVCNENVKGKANYLSTYIKKFPS